jgi:hypothetical protein
LSKEVVEIFTRTKEKDYKRTLENFKTFYSETLEKTGEVVVRENVKNIPTLYRRRFIGTNKVNGTHISGDLYGQSTKSNILNQPCYIKINNKVDKTVFFTPGDNVLNLLILYNYLPELLIFYRMLYTPITRSGPIQFMIYAPGTRYIDLLSGEDINYLKSIISFVKAPVTEVYTLNPFRNCLPEDCFNREKIKKDIRKQMKELTKVNQKITKQFKYKTKLQDINDKYVDKIRDQKTIFNQKKEFYRNKTKQLNNIKGSLINNLNRIKDKKLNDIRRLGRKVVYKTKYRHDQDYENYKANQKISQFETIKSLYESKLFTANYTNSRIPTWESKIKKLDESIQYYQNKKCRNNNYNYNYDNNNNYDYDDHYSNDGCSGYHDGGRAIDPTESYY